MLYELRIYSATPGKFEALSNRFSDHVLSIWAQYKIRPIGFWIPEIGGQSNTLYYILEWESLADRDARWSAFTSDPRWKRVAEATEREGPLTCSITNLILSPTSYSLLK